MFSKKKFRSPIIFWRIFFRLVWVVPRHARPSYPSGNALGACPGRAHDVPATPRASCDARACPAMWRTDVAASKPSLASLDSPGPRRPKSRICRIFGTDFFGQHFELKSFYVAMVCSPGTRGHPVSRSLHPDGLRVYCHVGWHSCTQRRACEESHRAVGQLPSRDSPIGFLAWYLTRRSDSGGRI